MFTMYDARTNLSLQVVENVRRNLEQNIYNAIIPRNVRLAEAPSHGLPISMYDPKSTGADAYRDLADEILVQDGYEIPETTFLADQSGKKKEEKNSRGERGKKEKGEKKKLFRRKN